MRFVALLCAFTVAFSSVAFAASATPSNAVPASYSNAQIKDAQVGSDALNPVYFGNDVVLMSDGDDSNYGHGWYYSATWASSSDTKFVSGYLGSDGFYHFDSPGAGYRMLGLYLVIGRGYLPSSGTYGFTYDIKQGNVDVEIGSVRISTEFNKSNVDTEFGYYTIDSYSNTGTSYTGSCNLTINSYVSSLRVIINFKNPTTAFDVGSASWSFSFKSNTGDDVNADIGSVSDSDNLGSIASNTGQIVSGQSAIMDTIKEQIQYITMQIEAFWNQLAGEFTNLFDKLNQQIANDDQNTQDIISNLDQNTSDIINNIDQNTNTVTNGFDNSGMDSDNNRLSSSLDQYDQAEDDLLSDVNDNIDAIDFDITWDSLSFVISTVSDFLQELYERSGGFKIAVQLVLITSLASCAIGLYRLKGGG